MDERSIPLIKSKLSLTLPGHESHRMVMKDRKSSSAIDYKTLNPRQSAVLVHLYMHLGELHLGFIERPSYDGVHSNQISFPGGKAEKEDSSLEQTAIREANEEVNIEHNRIEMLGSLSEIYIPPSNFIVKPFVSYQDNRPNFIPDPREVQQIIETPLMDLIDQNLGNYDVFSGDQVIHVKGYVVGGKVLWGATAMITKEFLDVCAAL